jgi:hypothetical protein
MVGKGHLNLASHAIQGVSVNNCLGAVEREMILNLRSWAIGRFSTCLSFKTSTKSIPFFNQGAFHLPFNRIQSLLYEERVDLPHGLFGILQLECGASILTVMLIGAVTFNLQAKPRVRWLANVCLHIVVPRVMIPSLNNPPPIGSHCPSEENNKCAN